MKTLKRTSSLPSVSSLFNNFFDTDRMLNMDWGSTFSRVPFANVIEEEKEFKIELAAPGMKKNDFKVDIENNQLTISSIKQGETVDTAENYTRKEFSYNTFTRSFIIPDSVDASKIVAKYENGILILDLPKKPEAIVKLLKKEIAVH